MLLLGGWLRSALSVGQSVREAAFLAFEGFFCGGEA